MTQPLITGREAGGGRGGDHGPGGIATNFRGTVLASWSCAGTLRRRARVRETFVGREDTSSIQKKRDGRVDQALAFLCHRSQGISNGNAEETSRRHVLFVN